MKRLLTLLCLIGVLSSLQSCMIRKGSNMDYVRGSNISNNAEIVAINLPMWLTKPFIKKALKDDNDEESRAMAAIVKKLKKFRMMTLSNNDQEKNALILEDYHKYLKKNKFEELLVINSEGEEISVNARIDKDYVISRVSLLVHDEGDESVFMDIKGEFSLDELIQGLNKIKSKDKKLSTKLADTNSVIKQGL
ncbi:DUF4252 domain-containing protein [Sphingobacterium prati]|uniref:DUF4252 domain-containing protein n=1 Tax=Sphingobacterium prati TaxID=2737006 RepID=UPI001552B5B2|nr:DUF4252 domain-containing protein [Sphingobacterium prati]NPE45043.1 DUF4252 domain-containing protein [Sphingobacterium prati]